MEDKTYMQELQENLIREMSLIKKGKIIDFLKSTTEAVSDVEVAAALSLSVPNVKAELKSLIEIGFVNVTNSPMQQDLSSGGLVYSLKNQIKNKL